MADNKEAQLEKLEADRQKHVDAIAKLDDQIKSIRAELRSSKLAEAKKQAADYGFTATELLAHQSQMLQSRRQSVARLKRSAIATRTAIRGVVASNRF